MIQALVTHTVGTEGLPVFAYASFTASDLSDWK